MPIICWEMIQFILILAILAFYFLGKHKHTEKTIRKYLHIKMKLISLDWNLEIWNDLKAKLFKSYNIVIMSTPYFWQ